MAKAPQKDELAEAKRIAARMLAMPPDPKKAKPPKPSKETKGNGRMTKKGTAG